jgi:hypothetical protein
VSEKMVSLGDNTSIAGITVEWFPGSLACKTAEIAQPMSSMTDRVIERLRTPPDTTMRCRTAGPARKINQLRTVLLIAAC